MPIRGSPNGAGYLRPQAGRDRPESVVAINRNAWSQSIGMAGRDHPVRAFLTLPVSFTGSVYAAERCVAGNLSMCSSGQALTCVQPGRENGCCLKWACRSPHRNEGR